MQLSYSQWILQINQLKNMFSVLARKYEWQSLIVSTNLIALDNLPPRRKQIRLFGIDLDNLYPNPLGSHGKTIQSQVNCDTPDLDKYPNFSRAQCQHCILHPGEMLFIPAFVWHQVIFQRPCLIAIVSSANFKSSYYYLSTFR